MYTSFSILFFLRNRGKSESNLSTIYARITVHSKRSEFSTQHKATEKWARKLGKMTGTSAEARMVNRHLDDAN